MAERVRSSDNAHTNRLRTSETAHRNGRSHVHSLDSPSVDRPKLRMFVNMLESGIRGIGKKKQRRTSFADVVDAARAQARVRSGPEEHPEHVTEHRNDRMMANGAVHTIEESPDVHEEYSFQDEVSSSSGGSMDRAEAARMSQPQSAANKAPPAPAVLHEDREEIRDRLGHVTRRLQEQDTTMQALHRQLKALEALANQKQAQLSAAFDRQRQQASATYTTEFEAAKDALLHQREQEEAVWMEQRQPVLQQLVRSKLHRLDASYEQEIDAMRAEYERLVARQLPGLLKDFMKAFLAMALLGASRVLSLLVVFFAPLQPIIVRAQAAASWVSRRCARPAPAATTTAHRGDSDGDDSLSDDGRKSHRVSASRKRGGKRKSRRRKVSRARSSSSSSNSHLSHSSSGETSTRDDSSEADDDSVGRLHGRRRHRRHATISESDGGGDTDRRSRRRRRMSTSARTLDRVRKSDLPPTLPSDAALSGTEDGDQSRRRGRRHRASESGSGSHGRRGSRQHRRSASRSPSLDTSVESSRSSRRRHMSIDDGITRGQRVGSDQAQRGPSAPQLTSQQLATIEQGQRLDMRGHVGSTGPGSRSVRGGGGSGSADPRHRVLTDVVAAAHARSQRGSPLRGSSMRGSPVRPNSAPMQGLPGASMYANGGAVAQYPYGHMGGSMEGAMHPSAGMLPPGVHPAYAGMYAGAGWYPPAMHRPGMPYGPYAPNGTMPPPSQYDMSSGHQYGMAMDTPPVMSPGDAQARTAGRPPGGYYRPSPREPMGGPDGFNQRPTHGNQMTEADRAAYGRYGDEQASIRSDTVPYPDPRARRQPSDPLSPGTSPRFSEVVHDGRPPLSPPSRDARTPWMYPDGAMQSSHATAASGAMDESSRSVKSGSQVSEFSGGSHSSTRYQRQGADYHARHASAQPHLGAAHDTASVRSYESHKDLPPAPPPRRVSHRTPPSGDISRSFDSGAALLQQERMQEQGNHRTLPLPPQAPRPRTSIGTGEGGGQAESRFQDPFDGVTANCHADNPEEMTDEVLNQKPFKSRLRH